MYFAWLKWLIESWNSKKVSPVNISRGEPPITGVVSGHDHTGVPRHMIIDASPEQSIYCCSHTRPVTVFSHNSSRWLFLWWCWQCWVCHQPRWGHSEKLEKYLTLTIIIVRLGVNTTVNVLISTLDQEDVFQEMIHSVRLKVGCLSLQAIFGTRLQSSYFNKMFI